MSFLARLGKIILQVGAIATGVGPILKGAAPQSAGAVDAVTNDLTGLATIIVQVEAVGQAVHLPGDQKLAAAAPQIAKALILADAFRGHKIKDQALFLQGATKIADGLVDAMNALDDGNVKTQDQTT